MIYLILAIASSAAISIIMRASEKYVKNEMSMFMANFLFYKYNMKCNGIVMSAAFMKLGVLVPTIMAVGAIVLINFEKDAFSESKHMLWLLLLLLLSGFTDSMANVFDKVGDASQKDAYLLATFGTAFSFAGSGSGTGVSNLQCCDDDNNRHSGHDAIS